LSLLVVDPFEASKPYYLKAKKEIFSPDNIHHYRAKSAQVYSQAPMEVITQLASSSVRFNNRSF